MSVPVSPLSAPRALRRFGFRQTLRGALIVGAIAGLLMGAQGAAYAKAFPDQISRERLVASLKSVSAVNFLSGEVANAATPASYAIYKSLPLMVIVTGVWGLMVATRILRGNEEDGRFELLAAGTATKRRVSAQLLLGFGGALTVAAAVTFVLIAALGANPQVHLPVQAGIYMTAAVFLPGLFFAAVGVLTSQLAVTRGRAVLYGLVPLIVLFVARGFANSVTSANWVKQYTPFGWSDLLNPVLGFHAVWMLPSVLFAAAFISLGLFAAGKRDLGAASIQQSDTVASHFYLLRSPLSLAVRRSAWNVAWWAIGVIAFAAFFAALAGFSVDLAKDSSAFRQAFGAAGIDEQKIRLIFIGTGTLFIATALLVMATLHVAAIRADEARGYIDNLLVQPVRRHIWLVGRLLLIAALFTGISVLAALAVWGVAHLNHTYINIWLAIQGAMSLVGALALTLGIGVCFYGFWPRLAVPAMAIFIGWAFVVDILKSFFHVSGLVAKTSFLYYVPSDPSKTPDWTACIILVIIGAVLAAAGVMKFVKRDIVSE